MKRYYISIIMCCFAILAIAAPRNLNEPATPADIDAMQAIVARSVILNHNGASQETKKALQSININNINIEKVESSLKDSDSKYNEFLKLCKDITGLKPNATVSLGQAVDFFKNRIFNFKDSIVDVVCHTGDSAATKRTAKADIDSFIAGSDSKTENGAKIELTKDDNASGGEIDKTIDDSSNVEKEDVEVSMDDDTAKSASVPGWLKLLFAIIVVAIVAAVVYFYLTLKKANDRILEIEAKLRLTEADLKACQDHITLLKKEKKELENRNRELDERLAAQVNNIANGKGNNNRDAFGTSRPLAPNFVPKDYYGVNASNGMFTNLGNTYRKGEYLYHIVTTDGTSATYEFIDDASAIGLAKSSLSALVETACDITNDEMRTFNKIITIQKGRLVKDGDGWRIVNKAQVQLG